MTDTEYHRKLGMGREAYGALEDNMESRTYDGFEYRHVPDYRRGVERGTALIDGTVVRGFPKVPRTLVLETGIPSEFGGDDDENGAEIAVEEKLNGYNVRFARIDGDVLAFSRSGMVCPFTTRYIDRLVGLDPLFDAHPEAMVCGEMIGPENPFTAHDYDGVDSLAFRAFDWRDRESGEPLDVDERRERYAEFDVPQTEYFGTVAVGDAADAVDGTVRDLDADGREGVVMKSPDGTGQLKYTTSASTKSDLAFAFSLPFDYGQAFMFRRLIREGFQTVEREEPEEVARDRARELGEAILLSMRDSIRTVEDGGTVGEEHTVRADEETVTALLEHLRGQGLRLEIEADRREDGDRVVTFRKRVQASNDKIRNYLEGHIVRE